VSKAYWVNTFREISDPEKVERYAASAGQVMRDHGGRFLARGNPAAVFEAALPLRITIIEFPSVDAAVSAYESEAYQEALRVLDGGAVRDIRIITSAEE
jgi:uncharacterized protein (DUF1330 family)